MSKSKSVKQAEKKGLRKLKRKAVGLKRKAEEREEFAAAKKHKRSLIMRMLDQARGK